MRYKRLQQTVIKSKLILKLIKAKNNNSGLKIYKTELQKLKYKQQKLKGINKSSRKIYKCLISDRSAKKTN